MIAPDREGAAVEAPLALRVAIADPGSILPRVPGETVPSWSARAVIAAGWVPQSEVTEREARAFDRGVEAGENFEAARWAGLQVTPRAALTIANPYRADRLGSAS